MRKTLIALLSSWCVLGSALAQQALDDHELAQVSGGDGVGIAVHLSLNDPALPGASENTLAMGFNVDGQNTYIVIRDLHGSIDAFGLGLHIEKKPDGTDYVAIGLPRHVRFNNFGFDSLSAQSDPSAPVTESLGRININGNLSMQGQLRLWAH